MIKSALVSSPLPLGASRDKKKKEEWRRREEVPSTRADQHVSLAGRISVGAGGMWEESTTLPRPLHSDDNTRDVAMDHRLCVTISTMRLHLSR